MKIKQYLQQFLWASLMLMLSIHEATGQELKLALMKYDAAATGIPTQPHLPTWQNFVMNI